MTDSTPYVGYNYDAGNGYRLASIDYPNGRTVSYNYGETGTADDSLNRLSTITDDSTGQTLAAYSYLGLNTVATEDFQQPKIKLDYSGGNDTYTALDRFGRVRDQIWSDYGNDTTADGYSYTYDQAGNVQSRANDLDNALSETYEYNALDGLKSATRNDGVDQSWDLSGTGDWNSFTNNGTTQEQQSNGATKPRRLPTPPAPASESSRSTTTPAT